MVKTHQRQSVRQIYIIAGDISFPLSLSLPLLHLYPISALVHSAASLPAPAVLQGGEGAVIWALRIRTAAWSGEISPFGLNLA